MRNARQVTTRCLARMGRVARRVIHPGVTRRARPRFVYASDPRPCDFPRRKQKFRDRYDNGEQEAALSAPPLLCLCDEAEE
jgi:hypothetical protein